MADQVIAVVNESEEYIHASMNMDGIRAMAMAGISYLEFHPNADNDILKSLFRIIENVAQESDDKLYEFSNQVFMTAKGKFDEIDKDWTKQYKKRKETQN